jgi:hypothetical protein
MARSCRKRDVLDTAERLNNWRRWGPDDEIGALNFRPEDIVAAARLVRPGKVFPLGLTLDQNEPPAGVWGRSLEPIGSMLATGTDASAGEPDEIPRLNSTGGTGSPINPLAIKSEPGEGPR